MEETAPKKAYLDKHDIMAKYDCGISKALSIIRCIQYVNGGGALGKGKVLPTELEYWEANRGVKVSPPEPRPALTFAEKRLEEPRPYAHRSVCAPPRRK